MIGTSGSPGRRKYAWSEFTGRSGSTVRPAATSACAATWPPNTRCWASSGLTPLNRLTSSASSSSSSSSSSSGFRPTRRKLSEEDARGVEQLERDGLELADGVVDRHPDDV